MEYEYDNWLQMKYHQQCKIKVFPRDILKGYGSDCKKDGHINGRHLFL